MTADTEIVAIGALRLDGSDVGVYYEAREVASTTANRFVRLAERDGLLLDCRMLDCPHTVVLDLFDANGDIVDDRCVPDDAAWSALNSELALECNR